MYQEFFGLEQVPFDLAADPSLLVETSGERAALDAIGDLVRRRVGVITLEGWVGVGKTGLLRTYAHRADADRVRVLPIARHDFDRGMLLAALGEGLVGPFAPPPRFEELPGLLAGRVAAGQATVLLIDDAQALTDGALRALGAVAELGKDEMAPLSIVLAVRPPFVDLFSRPAAAALDQRASARVRLPPLAPGEARALIEERLRRAGAADPSAVLAPEAVDAIVVEAGGIPRKLLALGDRVLRAGFAQRRMPVDYATAEAAIRGGEGRAATPAPPSLTAPIPPVGPTRMRPPISADEGGLSGMASAMGRGIGRVAIPVSLLIVALGLGYWLWTQPENAPSAPPTEAQAGLPATASDTPTPAPQQQTMAPPPAPAASPPLPQHAEIQPPPAAPATPAVTAPDVAAKPADVLFIPARRGDTLRSLYRAAYRAPRDRPSFEQLLAANPGLASDKPLDAGELVALPGPGGR
jgi:type II secretory pathway predicted ATPase ExeA/phage tail protein X